MPKVYNRAKDRRIPINAVYVGRPGPWGNPYIIGEHGDRGEVVVLYRQWLTENPALVERAKRELKGKDLVCWCAPDVCHADVLMEIANS